ncbi:hypothetical protein AB0K51_25480, partial [Kitasatospora sp. NPDC049285]|uniref:hypothetical protein n=1 Tax=Kitasatospora sp. NPDC049285 TaxID=3157096 RepID=UPI003418CB1A
PVRRYQGGAWKNLDATLVKRADGGVGPALSSTDLVLSGGGNGPLATMKSGAASFSLDLPKGLADKLPAPVLDGSTATYALAPGLDLKVTADTLGGFSEVFVVKDAKAAANPALKKLSFATKANGVDLATDQAGNLTAKDKHGKVLFSAPAPDRGVWDSAADQAAPTVTEPKSGAKLDAVSGFPAASSHAEPGAHAHTGKLTSEYRDGAVTLTPDQDLLGGKDTVWPLYIDPSYAGGSLYDWTYVSSAFTGTSYWHTSDSTGLRVGYNGWQSPYYVGRAFARLGVPSSIYGAQVSSSTFYATETWSPSCSARNVEAWWTDGILSTTNWSNQPSWRSQLDTKNEAHGYSSSCPAAGVGFNATSLMQNAANGHWGDVTIGLKASDEGDAYGWKKFQPSSMSISTTYNHTPNQPGSLSTSPSTACTASTPTVVGNGDVVLNASVSDPDGGDLGVIFTLANSYTWKVVASTTSSFRATSGTTASFVIPRSTLTTEANGAITNFAWNVKADDGQVIGPESALCRFTFDPTVPGAPSISQPSGNETVGTGASFTFTRNPGGTAPSSYLYQLNGGAPLSVNATNGNATVSVKPTRRVNTLSVTAISPGGNVGDTANLVINAKAPAVAAANDLTGDGRPDLAVVGGQANLPAGLWLSTGTTTTTLNAAADNIGAKGTGVNTAGSSADWTGTQVITGHFATGDGFNDYLAYNPATGRASIVYGNGDGSALNPVSGSQVNVDAAAFTASVGGAKAAQVANAGTLYETAAGANPALPGLLMVFNGQLTLTGGTGTPGAYAGADTSVPLTTASPNGSGDWTSWTITTALVNNLPALYARNTATGELWYYSPTVLTNLAAIQILGTSPTPTAPVRVAASGWTALTAPVLQAADINGDGTADLWSVDGSGKAAPNLFNGTTLSGTGNQGLFTPSHNWQLNDSTNNGATATTAADSTGNSPLTGQSGATWSTSDIFNPDVHFNATGSGVMTAGSMIDLTQSFTVSVWAKAGPGGGVMVSQDGNQNSGFMVYAEAPGGQWKFCMSRIDNGGWNYDCANAGAGGGIVQAGIWTHLTATYNRLSNVMALYINGLPVGSLTHAPVAGFNGSFRVGDFGSTNGGHFAQFNGAISNVQLWNGTALSPTQAALLSGTPGYVLFPADDTSYPSGSNWSAAHGNLSFTGGQLKIVQTGWANGNTWTAGVTGYPGAVLTLQRDGNLVVYPNAAKTFGTALWSSNTYNNSDDCMLLQPDGNLVIYRIDGVPIWSSGTYN